MTILRTFGTENFGAYSCLVANLGSRKYFKGNFGKYLTPLPRYVNIWHIDGDHTVEEHKDPKQGWEHQHLVVESQPGEVKTNLVAKVTLDQPQRLFFVKVCPVGPFLKQQLRKYFADFSKIFCGQLSYPSITFLSLRTVNIMSSFMKRKASFEDLLVHQPDHPNLVRPGNIVRCPQQNLPDYLSSLGAGEELLPIFQNVFVI